MTGKTRITGMTRKTELTGITTTKTLFKRALFNYYLAQY